jgi:hypothetical protein
MRTLCDCLKTLLGLISLLLVSVAAATDSPAELAPLYAREVDRRLEVPAAEQGAYAKTMEDALHGAQIVPSTGQYVVLVDRNPNVQAVMLFWRSSTGNAVFIGASPTSTGRPGGFDRYGILDADYEQAIAAGQTFWVLRRDRTPTPWSGRYRVVVDSPHKARPAWSPLPPRR